MGKIYCLMGKSASGKDSTAKAVLTAMPELKPIVPYTTRPMRSGEKDGVDYHFCNDEKWNELVTLGKVIETREYNTTQGVWRYFTASEDIDLTENDYLYVTTPEACQKLKKYFDGDTIIPICIDVEDGERLRRAIGREKRQENPDYVEVCRRFIADEKDFAPEILESLGAATVKNDGLDEAVGKVLGIIRARKGEKKMETAKNLAVVHTHGIGAETGTFKTEVLALLPDSEEGEAEALAILRDKEEEYEAKGRYTYPNREEKWLFVGADIDEDTHGCFGPDYRQWDNYEIVPEPQGVDFNSRAGLEVLVDGLTAKEKLSEQYRWLVKCNPKNLTELKDIFLNCEDAGKSWAGALQVLLHRLYARALPFDETVGDCIPTAPGLAKKLPYLVAFVDEEGTMDCAKIAAHDRDELRQEWMGFIDSEGLEDLVLFVAAEPKDGSILKAGKDVVEDSPVPLAYDIGFAKADGTGEDETQLDARSLTELDELWESMENELGAKPLGVLYVERSPSGDPKGGADDE